MKAIRSADAANAALIGQAIRFDIALFLGAGGYDRASVQTQEEAVEIAVKIAPPEHRRDDPAHRSARERIEHLTARRTEPAISDLAQHRIED